MSETWSIVYEGVSYPCTVTFKRVRNINFRLARDGKSMKVSAPYGTSESYLRKKIGDFFPRLKQKTAYPEPINGDEVYLFGTKETIDGFSLLDEKKKQRLLKGKLLAYIKEKEPYYESLMGIAKPYGLRVRLMRSRYGVNSFKTHRLTFALELVHYAPSIVDSVIIHELAHDFERNHGKAFYAIVYRYCPDYKKRYASLRKHEYANG
jgi:predicted metal-dependent hydrolase